MTSIVNTNVSVSVSDCDDECHIKLQFKTNDKTYGTIVDKKIFDDMKINFSNIWCKWVDKKNAIHITFNNVRHTVIISDPIESCIIVRQINNMGMTDYTVRCVYSELV
jgi:hypothetical protein